MKNFVYIRVFVDYREAGWGGDPNAGRKAKLRLLYSAGGSRYKEKHRISTKAQGGKEL